MIRVLVADESEIVRANIARRLELEQDMSVCAAVGDGETAVQEALWLRPDIAVVDAGLPGMDGGQTTQMLVQFLPSTGVIMMSMEAENDAYRLAMLAGAREFLQKPFRGDDLVSAIRRVHEFLQRRAQTVTVAPQPEESATPAAASPAAGTVTAVLAGKGGVGKTVMAVNLAVALHEARSRRVVLVDLSLQFGDVAATLALPTDRTISDLLMDSHATDPQLVRQTLVTAPGGISVLLAPRSPEIAQYVTSAHLQSLIEALRADFDHIVIDTPPYLTEEAMSVLGIADHVVLITDLSVPGVKNTRLVRGVLEELSVLPTRVQVVANHREAAGELDEGGAESFLGAAITAEIPYSPEVIATSVNHGTPFVLSHPASAPSAAVRAVANAIDPMPHHAAGERATLHARQKRRPRRMLSFSR